MNKWLAGAVAGLVFGAFSAASALDMSYGGGLYFNMGFGGGNSVSVAGTELYKNDPSPWGVGGYGFFDVTYAELGVGVSYGAMKWTTAYIFFGDLYTYQYELNTVNLDLSLLGKYPIALSETMSLFPLIGATYTLNASVSFSGSSVEYDGSDLINQLFINLGFGMDIAVGDKMYVRPMLVYGLGLGTKFDKDMADALGSIPGVDAEAPLSHSIAIKVGVGFKM